MDEKTNSGLSDETVDKFGESEESEEYPGPSETTEIIGDYIPQVMKTQEGKVVFKAVRRFDFNI